jgi:hypothetical protein
MIRNGKFIGKVIHKWPEEQIKPDLVKTILVIEEQKEEYPGTIAIDFMNQWAKQVQGIEKGDIVEVEVNFRAREYSGKRYNSLKGWRINKINDSEAPEGLPF